MEEDEEEEEDKCIGSALRSLQREPLVMLVFISASLWGCLSCDHQIGLNTVRLDSLCWDLVILIILTKTLVLFFKCKKCFLLG